MPSMPTMYLFKNHISKICRDFQEAYELDKYGDRTGRDQRDMGTQITSTGDTGDETKTRTGQTGHERESRT